MRNRCFLALLTVATVVLLVSMPAFAQTQADSDPQTPGGDPNLQGTWSYASLTPLQRPTSLAEREFYSEEEAAEHEASERRRAAGVLSLF